MRLAFWLGPTNQLPPTLDYCAPKLAVFGTSPTANTLIAARDTGELTLASPVALYPGVMFAFLPVYQGDKTPSTVQARRQQLIGWVAGTFDGNAIINTAEAGRQNLRVDVVARIGGQNVSLASAGAKLKGHVSSLTVPVGDGGTWWVTVSGTSLGGTSATAQGVAVFGLGLIISVLIFGVMQVLLRSRGRALRLVREQTEELRYRALHDDLTGLPNRALIMDRIEQMLGRTRRQGVASAVLFVDLDSFKDVNDTYGHAAGDALLRAVADRLLGSIRETDTAGRIGGDEFIVLLEGASLTDGVPAVAQRLLDALELPFTLTELPGVTLNVRASVGIADVDGDSPDTVLRNADMALYEAKAAGKSRFTVYSS
jgi:diguanylate cyclase (GGDEF)-like protein